MRRPNLPAGARNVGFVIAIGLALCQCGDDGAPADNHADSMQSILFAVVSDLHIAPEESEPQNRLFSFTAEVLNAHSPPLDFVVCTGDLVERLPSDDPDYYRDHSDTAIDQLVHLTGDLTMPFYPVMGNHDYYSAGIFPIVTGDKEAREQLYEDKGVMPAPYYAFEHRGVKFCFLNSMQQDPTVTWSPNAVGTFGPDQLAWLRDQLSDNKPAFLFQHHALATEITTQAGFSSLTPFEIPRAAGSFPKYQASPFRDYTDPIYEILESRNRQIRADFFGHSHLFLKDEYAGIPIFMTDSMKFPSHSEYDGKPMRYHIVECQAHTGNFRIYNEHMIPYFQAAVPVESSPLSGGRDKKKSP